MEISDPGADGEGVDRDPNQRKRKGKEVKSSASEEKTGHPFPPSPSPRSVGRRETTAQQRGKSINSPRAPLPLHSGKVPSPAQSLFPSLKATGPQLAAGAQLLFIVLELYGGRL